MKRRKILVLIPALGLLLSGCTFQEGFATAKHWVGQNIYHPVKDWIDSITGKKKDEQKPSGDEGGGGEETEDKFTVTFNVQGHGTAPASVEVEEGGKVTKPTDPSADGWTFGGWFKEAACTNAWDFANDTVTADVTLYAKWTENGGGDTTNYGTEDSPLSVSDALAVIQKECTTDGSLTKQRIYCVGLVSVVDNTYSYDSGPCFELHVADKVDNTKVVHVYRVHCTEEQKANVVVGAEIKFSGFAKNFKDELEFVDNGQEACSILTVTAPSGEDPVTGVTFDAASYEVSVGGTKKVSATVAPLTAKNRNVTYSLKEVDPAGCVTISGDTLSGVAEGSAKVVATTEDGGFTAEVPVTVKPASANQMVEAYNAALALTSGETEKYTVQGVIVAKRGTNEFFIQSEGYGIEYFGSNSSFDVGKEVKVVSTFQNYHGLPETKTIDTTETTVIKEVGEMPAAVEISTAAKLAETKLNVLSNVVGVAVKDASDYAASSDYTLSLTTPDGSIDVFIKKNLFTSKENTIKSIKQGDTVSLESVVTAIRDTNRQVTFCAGTEITINPAPAKEISEFGEVTGPTSIQSGGSVALKDVQIAVTYSDSTPGSVNPTSIDPFDNETVAKGVEVTVHYEKDGKVFEGTFTLEVTKKAATIETTAHKTIEEVASENSWVDTTKYESFSLDENVTVSIKTGGGNTGKYYSSDKTWRLYESENAVCEVSAGEFNIKTVAVTFAVKDSGTMTVNGSSVESGVAQTVNASTFSFGVGHSGTASGGKLLLKEIEVVYEVPDTSIPVSSVELDEDSLTLYVGDSSEPLTATVLPVDATDPSVTWKSSDSEVATVADGVITAVGSGTAQITAVADGVESEPCVVTVREHVSSVTISHSVSVVQGQTNTISISVLPESAYDKTYSLTSLDETIATVDQDGTVHGIAPGETTITITTNDLGLTDVCNVTVTDSAVHVESVELDCEETIEMFIGDELTLGAHVLPENTTDEEGIEWALQDSESGIVSVYSYGKIVALGEGTATVRATSVANVDAYADVTITVSRRAVESVSLNESEVELNTTGASSEFQLIATVVPNNATINSVSWSSNNESVATVDENGLVTAQGVGEATITVTTTDGSFTDSCVVNVSEVVVEDVVLTADGLELAGYADGSNADFAWTQLCKHTASSTIQGNSSKSSEIHNTTEFGAEINHIELVVGNAAGVNTTGAVTFGSEASPSENSVAIGKDTDYSLTETGLLIVPAPSGCTYFKLAWTNGAAYYSSIKVCFSDPEPVAPESVAITCADEVVLNETLELTASVTPSYASQDVSWEIVSGGTGAGTLEGNVLTGTSVGTVVVQATANGTEISEQKTITVVEEKTQVKNFNITPADGSPVTSDSNYSIVKNGVTVAVNSSQMSSDMIKVYKNQTLTVSCDSAIVSIIFTCTTEGDAKYGPGCFTTDSGYTFDSYTGTWTGSATSVVFTASSNQVRITNIAIVLA